MSKNPSISIIIPVFNASKFLTEAINSILKQSYTDFELLLIDDCSTDNSLQIMNSHAEIDNRIIVLKQEENSGPAATRNLGLDNANGEYIAFLDSDDISIDTRLEEQVSIFLNDKNKEIGIVGSWYTEFYKNKKKHLVKTFSKPEEIKIAFLTHNCLGTSTAMIRKSVIKNVRFCSNYIVCEDYFFWCELLNKTKFYIIQKSLVLYRVHNEGISKVKINQIETNDKLIKLNLYKAIFNVEIKESENQTYFDLFNYKKEQKPSELIEIIKLGERLVKINNANENLDCKLFNKRIYFLLVKSIKKGNVNWAFFKRIKKEHSLLFRKIDLLTIVKTFIK